MTTTQQKPRPLDAVEVAHYLRVDVGVVYKYVKKDKLPAYKVGSRLLFYEEDVEQWIKAHKLPQPNLSTNTKTTNV